MQRRLSGERETRIRAIGARRRIVTATAPVEMPVLPLERCDPHGFWGLNVDLEQRTKAACVLWTPVQSCPRTGQCRPIRLDLVLPTHEGWTLAAFLTQP